MVRYDGMHVYFNTFLVCVLLDCLLTLCAAVAQQASGSV